jgi:hypothetical protein
MGDMVRGRGVGVVCVVIEGGDVMRSGMLAAHGCGLRMLLMGVVVVVEVRDFASISTLYTRTRDTVEEQEHRERSLSRCFGSARF